jgi:hypothetical protein
MLRLRRGAYVSFCASELTDTPLALAAGGIVVHCTTVIAVRETISAGQIFHRISHVGVGVEQTSGIAGVSHRAGRLELDLRHPVVACAHHARIAAALTRRTRSSGRLFAAACCRISASRLPLASTTASRCFCANAGVAANATRVVISVSLRVMGLQCICKLWVGKSGFS